MTTLSLKMLSAVAAASSHGPQNNHVASKLVRGALSSSALFLVAVHPHWPILWVFCWPALILFPFSRHLCLGMVSV